MLGAPLTSAEISLPGAADALRVRERIAALADAVDVVGLTDNHAGQPRMSPLAAVALAREQGVATIVHASTRDRNRLALQSHVVGAATLGSEGVLCLQGDPVDGVKRVGDLKASELIASATGWVDGAATQIGAVVNPFASDLDRELRLLEKKRAAGATFLQTQMVFDLDARSRRSSTVPRICLMAHGCMPASRCCAPRRWPSASARSRTACSPTSWHGVSRRARA